MLSMKKYKLVVFGDPWDVYQVAHRDWIDDPNVTYISTFRPGGLLGQLQRLQFNPKINSIFKIPWKSCWNRYCLREIRGEKLCFLVTGYWLRHESGIQLLPYLRRHYPESLIVCYFQDLINTNIDIYSHKIIDLNHIKKYSNLLISYDRNDANKHHTLYHPTVFSPIAINPIDTDDLYDLYFLGYDKGRLPLLIDICHEAKKRNLRCKFMMIRVPKEKRIPCEDIEYIDESISYYENLRYSASSRCILEILQQTATSATFRTWETIMLSRKLITNNMSITESDIYDAKYISVFHNLTDFDWSFVASNNNFPGKNPFQDAIRPKALVHFIEEQLQINIEQA